MISIVFAVALALNSAVNQGTIKTTICVPGWTDTVRPKVDYTENLKRKQLPKGAHLADYREDHVIPLCLGGAPRDPQNLRPQLLAPSLVKDREEKSLCKAVCAKTHPMSLKAAQAKIAKDWP